MAELPHLEDIYYDYEDRDVQILSINAIDREGKVESDAELFQLLYPVLVGRDSDIVSQYKIRGLPRLFIIDREGKVVLYKKFAPYEDIAEILDARLSKEDTPSETDSGEVKK